MTGKCKLGTCDASVNTCVILENKIRKINYSDRGSYEGGYKNNNVSYEERQYKLFNVYKSIVV